MNNRIKAFASAAVLVMGLAGPAGAAHTPEGEEFAPEYTETAVYLHCNGSKIGNVDATANSNLVTWDTTKPSASYQTGAGCGTVETAFSGTTDHNPLYDFPVRGTFTGNIENLTVRYWTIDTVARALGPARFSAHLVIDGTDVLARAGDAPNVSVTPVDSSGPARLVEFTVTGIGLDSAADHVAEHEIQLSIETWYLVNDAANIWVYDAAEIDSGLVFNDTTPAAVKVPSTT